MVSKYIEARILCGLAIIFYPVIMLGNFAVRLFKRGKVNG